MCLWVQLTLFLFLNWRLAYISACDVTAHLMQLVLLALYSWRAYKLKQMHAFVDEVQLMNDKLPSL
jgi:hypothetical protein